MPSGYRLAPPLAARLLGGVLVLVAVLVVVLTVLTVLLGWPATVILGAAMLGLVGIPVAGWVLWRGARVVTLDDAGYHVRWVRGAGVRAAGWREVEDAVTADVGGIDCVVLRLKDGRTTSVPVTALAADRNTFVADVREHLRRAQGLRPL